MNKIVIIKTNGHIIKNFSKKLKLNLNSKTKGTIAIDNKNEVIQAIKSPTLSRLNLKLQIWHLSFNLKIFLNINPL